MKQQDIRKTSLAKILAEIPWEVWERIVREEPEWRNMESSLNHFGYGPFAVLMVTTGLNDYQLNVIVIGDGFIFLTN